MNILPFFVIKNWSIVTFFSYQKKFYKPHSIFPTEKKMATPLGTSFSTDENVVAQVDVKLLLRTVESLVIELDQGKFEKFLSSGSASSKIMRQYRKVPLATAPESLQRFLLKWLALLLTAQAGPLLTRFWKPLVQPTRRASMSLMRSAGLMHRDTIKVMVKINPTIILFFLLCNYRLLRVPNNPCDSTEMLSDDRGTAPVVSKLKKLQLQSLLLLQKARLRPASLDQNTRSAFVHKARSAFSAHQHQNARFASLFQSLRPAFIQWLNQNARSAFLFENTRTVLRGQLNWNATFVFLCRNAKSTFRPAKPKMQSQKALTPIGLRLVLQMLPQWIWGTTW